MRMRAPFGIKTHNTSSGQIELDALSQASGYNMFTLRAPSDFAESDAPNA
jgi:hypothetical protein